MTQDTKIDVKIDPAPCLLCQRRRSIDLRRRAKASALTTTGRTAKELPETIPAPGFVTTQFSDGGAYCQSGGVFIARAGNGRSEAVFLMRLYLPLGAYNKAANGFIMPAVIYDDENETNRIKALIRRAVANGRKTRGNFKPRAATACFGTWDCV